MSEDNVAERRSSVDDSPILPQVRKNSISLEKSLQNRPERGELVERNILPSTADPALLAHQVELKKHMTADHLKDKLSHRPSPEELVNEGILHEDPRKQTDDEATERYREAIELEYAKREGGA